jgi:hypothetical protein
LCDEPLVGDGQFDGLLRADVDTTTTATACVADDSLTVDQMDGVNKAYALRTGSAAGTTVSHGDLHTGHSCDLGTNLGSHVWQDPPQAAARTTVTNRQQLVARADAKPYGIELVAANQVNQTCLTAAGRVIERFFFRYAASELGIDPHGRLSKKETAQINGVILTLDGIAAYAGVHDPVKVGLLDEMFYHPRWQDHLAWIIERLVDRNHLILGQVDDVVSLEEQVVDDSGDERYVCQPGQEETLREELLYELDEPDRLTHGDARLVCEAVVKK